MTEPIDQDFLSIPDVVKIVEEAERRGQIQAQALEANFNRKLADNERRIAALEEQVTVMVIGFGEQAVTLETLITKLAFKTDEERNDFKTSLEESRVNMLKRLRDHADDLATDGSEDTTALKNVVEEKLSDSGGS